MPCLRGAAENSHWLLYFAAYPVANLTMTRVDRTLREGRASDLARSKSGMSGELRAAMVLPARSAAITLLMANSTWPKTVARM